jgi:hypothetical protein
MILLSHTQEEGTVLRGDTRPFRDVIKSFGFRWYGVGGFWYLPRSRGAAVPRQSLETWAAPLRHLGADVRVAPSTLRYALVDEAGQIVAHVQSGEAAHRATRQSRYTGTRVGGRR